MSEALSEALRRKEEILRRCLNHCTESDRRRFHNEVGGRFQQIVRAVLDGRRSQFGMDGVILSRVLTELGLIPPGTY